MHAFWDVFSEQTREKMVQAFHNQGGVCATDHGSACPIGYALMEEFGIAGYPLLGVEEAEHLLSGCVDYDYLVSGKLHQDIEDFMYFNDNGQITNLSRTVGLTEMNPTSVVRAAEDIIREHQVVSVR